MGAPLPLTGEQAEQADPEPEAKPAPGDAAASDPGDGPTAKRFSVNEGRKEAERRRQNIGNQLHFCARVLCRSFNNRLWIGMVPMTNPLHEFFADGVAKIKTLGSQHFVGDMVQGSLQKVSGKLLSHLLGAPMVAAIGMRTAASQPRCPAEQAADQAVADTLWLMLASLTGSLMQTSLMWKAPSLCSTGLISDPEACRAEWLCKLRAGWEALERLSPPERTAQSNTEARR